MQTMRFFGSAGTPAAAAKLRAGAMDSIQGRAMATPVSRRKVRLERGLNISNLQPSWVEKRSALYDFVNQRAKTVILRLNIGDDLLNRRPIRKPQPAAGRIYQQFFS